MRLGKLFVRVFDAPECIAVLVLKRLNMARESPLVGKSFVRGLRRAQEAVDDIVIFDLCLGPWHLDREWE